MSETPPSKPDDPWDTPVVDALAGDMAVAAQQEPGADDTTAQVRQPLPSTVPDTPVRTAEPATPDPDSTTDYPVHNPPWPPAAAHQPAQQHQPPPATPVAPAPAPDFPPFPAPTGRARADRRKLAGVAAGAAGLAALLVAALWWPGFLHRTALDVGAAQEGVKQVLSGPDGYGVADVSEVTCNNGKNPTVRSGRTFGCEVVISGEKRHVTVTFADKDGTYWVGLPS